MRVKSPQFEKPIPVFLSWDDGAWCQIDSKRKRELNKIVTGIEIPEKAENLLHHDVANTEREERAA